MALTSDIYNDIASRMTSDIVEPETKASFRVHVEEGALGETTYFGYHELYNLGSLDNYDTSIGDGSLAAVLWGDNNTLTFEVGGDAGAEAFEYLQIGTTRYYRTDASSSYPTVSRWVWSISNNPLGTAGTSLKCEVV